MKKTGKKIITTNHKARRDYEIEDQFEAGIVLAGHEVKSIRNGKITIEDSFGRIENNEAYLYNAYITPYLQATLVELEPSRRRKLLLHRREINRLFGLVQRKGYALVPLDLYFKDGRVKVTLAIGKGKRLHDKRETIKKRELTRDLQRNFKGKRNI
ncbi:MAG: SsrA-binding protein SmpB [bacterium]